MKLLLDKRLCTRSDLRRCRRRVRKLARDLPAFDCVWIDALQQLKKITPYQARILQSQHPVRIVLGPYLLFNRLGSGQSANTFLAQSPESNHPCALKAVDLPPEHLEETLDRLKTFIARTKGLEHRSLATIKAALLHEQQLIIVSKYVQGETLSELMIRRGRFPAREVLAIAGELIDALATLESHQQLHGEIRLGNVRMTARGNVVLVDGGIVPAIAPEMIISPHFPPEKYEGIAPELIGTGAERTGQSEMYALGCLLWQLLAGRSPFPTGDPLAKLALHQTRSLPDIREWAPDTPADLAELIGRLTRINPNERPESFAQLRNGMRISPRANRRVLNRFHKTLHNRIRSVSSRNGLQRGYSWTTVGVLLILVSGLAVTLMDAGTRSQLLQIASPVTTYFNNMLPQDDNPSSTVTQRRNVASSETSGVSSILRNAIPIPPPDVNGEIRLTTNGPYRWDSKIDAVGAVVIKAATDLSPVLFVSPGECRISADEVRFENIDFHLLQKPAESTLPQKKTLSYIVIQSRNLSIQGCRFQLHSANQDSRSSGIPEFSQLRTTAFSWLVPDSADRISGQFKILNSISYGGFDTVTFVTSPNLVLAENCLKTGNGRMLRFSQSPRSGKQCQVHLKHVTLRQAASLLGLSFKQQSEIPGTIQVEATDCVFDFRKSNGAMFHLFGEMTRTSQPLIHMSGVGSVANPGLVVAGHLDQTGSYRPIRNTEQWILFEGGILSAPFQFSGPPDGSPLNSRVHVRGIPRRSNGSPGIEPSRFSLK